MKTHDMDKEKWVALFEAIGMEKETMHAWHREFERRFPDGHQAFLEWLKIPDEEIRTIRQKSANG